MARRRKRTGERGTLSLEPKPEFEYESYRRSDGAMGGRLVIATERLRKLDARHRAQRVSWCEPFGEDAWQGSSMRSERSLVRIRT